MNKCIAMERSTSLNMGVRNVDSILQRKSSCGQHTVAQGEDSKRQGILQRTSVGNTIFTPDVPPIVHDVLNSSGQALDAGIRTFMEPRFGHDFSGVRVHTDARAAESARSVNALAYTVGRNVVFGMGQYALGTGEGKRLLAHELTHVVQQGGGTGIQTKLEIGRKKDYYEQEAEQISEQVTQGSNVNRVLPMAARYIQRKIGDNHDLNATRFSGDEILEEVYDGKKLLQKSDSGKTVKLIQESLLAQGYNLPVFGADGKFGKETEAAIKTFQIQTGAVKLDGIVGAETMQLLNMHDPGTTEATGPIGPGVVATSAVFAESPDEKYAGYDASVVPNWLVVPLNGRREAQVTSAPAGARPVFVSRDPAKATVTTTGKGVAVTGIAAGATDIEAKQGATVLGTLRILIKDRRNFNTGFHYVCDSKVPTPHCTTGTQAESPRILALLNRVWERQANVRFTDAGSRKVVVPGDFGAAVDWTSPTGGEWNTVTATGMGAAYNLFRVWHYLKDGVDQNDAANLGVNTLVGDHPCADGLGPAHETGHFLGLDHPDNFIMTACGGRVDERVSKAMVDKVNP